MPRTPLRYLPAYVLATALIGTGLGAGTATAASQPPTAVATATPQHTDTTPGPIASPGGNGVRNPFSPAYGANYRHGVMPTLEVKKHMDAWAAANPAPAGTTTGPQTLAYGGGIDGIGVQSGAKVKVYLVFYGTQWGTQTTNSRGDLTFSGDAAGAAGAAQEMFKGIGTNNELWSAALTQWCDGPNVTAGATSCPTNGSFVPYPSGGVLAGSWYDNTAASPAAATQQQLSLEAANAAKHFGNITAAANRNSYYVILSPHGTNPDNYQGPPVAFCAWHSYTNSAILGGGVASGYGDIAYANQPYNIDVGAGCGAGFVNSPGTLDGYTITLGHEWQEAMSDQNPNGGWTNQQSSSPHYGEENSDECAWIAPGTAGGAANITFATGTFAEQSNWSNDTNSCAISHTIRGDVITVNPIPNQAWMVLIPYALQTSGSSSQGKTLSWSATGLPSGLSIALSTGLIAGAPLAAGSGTATVTATDSTPASASTTFSWTVNALLEAVTVTNPGNQTGTVGTPASLQISASDSAGKPLTYSASGLPAGLAINAATGLITGTPTTSATSSVVVTASSGSAFGSTTFTWTVNPAATVDLANGGFETGAFAPWTTTGTASIVSTGAHSGTRAAQLGSTLPTNGDSTATQRFTVPTGSGLLSFWYNLTCPDQVTYDWATATLTDNGTGNTTTVLARTCAASSGWTKVNALVNPGHAYTLTLISHDDNSSLDPTYTKFDDITVTPNPVVNGSFETGTFSGWTTSGAAASIVNTGAHTGTYAARLGSTSPTNGDSTATQNFTAASNDSVLYVYYNQSCAGAVSTDWATVTLKDQTTGTTTTLLAKTCAAASGWKGIGATIVPGHAYTITLTNHDDNKAGSPTSTLFDDVIGG
ncbi:MAG: hypothetical protein AUG49_23990 [Catenulispora sp. 13_1_20CM_3_70_7]|nr:MAG: hypothetical protein AUG49_23990 [Catenulispora sp. 13_1_20CM_3_70_7]